MAGQGQSRDYDSHNHENRHRFWDEEKTGNALACFFWLWSCPAHPIFPSLSLSLRLPKPEGRSRNCAGTGSRAVRPSACVRPAAHYTHTQNETRTTDRVHSSTELSIIQGSPERRGMTEIPITVLLCRYAEYTLGSFSFRSVRT